MKCGLCNRNMRKETKELKLRVVFVDETLMMCHIACIEEAENDRT